MYEKQKSQLSDLIELINGDLSKNDRKKLITLCTIDVHARDVVQRLIDERVENGQCFQWQSQLRYYQNEKTKECQVGSVIGGKGRPGAGCPRVLQRGEGLPAWDGGRVGDVSIGWQVAFSSVCLGPSSLETELLYWLPQVNICDAEIKYMYEYIGNCGCLCITPLTDRCYITLTQAQRLVLGELGRAGRRGSPLPR